MSFKALGNHHQTLCWFYLGIAQIAVRPPSTLKRALWTLFFGHFLKGCMVLIVKGAPNHLGKGLSPLPPNGQCPNRTCIVFDGVSLRYRDRDPKAGPQVHLGPIKMYVTFRVNLDCVFYEITESFWYESSRAVWFFPRQEEKGQGRGGAMSSVNALPLL